MIKVIPKTFQIIETLAQGGSFTLKDVSQQSQQPKPTAYRILQSLHEIGYVKYDADRSLYALDSRFLSLVRSSATHNDLLSVARPYMVRLQGQFGETVNLARFAENSAVFVHIEQTKHQFRYVDDVGQHAALHSTALGKAICAFLPSSRRDQVLENYTFQKFTRKTLLTREALEKELEKIRQAGTALDNEEGTLGVICVGAPIFNHLHEPFSAMSISIPKMRYNPKALDAIRKSLAQACTQISLELGVTDIRRCLTPS